jgi:sugar/nucleoside kinase (ribokinase family)
VVASERGCRRRPRGDGCREKLTVVTKGERGCTASTDGETFDVPGFPVDAVSTLGTRDSFRALDGRSTIPSWDELEASVA